MFIIKGGAYRTIARGLRRRGWVAQNYKIATPTSTVDDGKRTTRGGGRSLVKGSSDDESSSDDSDGDSGE